MEHAKAIEGSSRAFEKKKDERRRKRTLTKAIQERGLAAGRTLGRIDAWTPKKEATLGVELLEMVEALRTTAHIMGLPANSVRGYTYSLGDRVMARLRLFPGTDDIAYYLGPHGVEGAWQKFLPGTWFEVSFLWPPKDDPYKGKKRDYFSRYQNMIEIQTFGTADPKRLFPMLRLVLWPRLKAKGYKPPQEIVFRVARTLDGSKPFVKKRPPV